MIINSQNYKTFFIGNRFLSLSSEERERLVSCAVENLCKEKGLKNATVSFEKMKENTRGQYNPDTIFTHLKGHKIKLNQDFLTTQNTNASYILFNTINHELEHAKQYENASNPHIKNSDAATLEQKLNDEHYYSSKGDKIITDIFGTKIGRTYRFHEDIDFQLYRAQASEAEARVAGMKAVEELKESNLKNGFIDEDIDNYLIAEQTNEYIENKKMVNLLGMHPRESLVKEELSHISTQKISEEDRQRVIDYARNKDYETAKVMLQSDHKGNLSEEQTRRFFETNNGYVDFFKTNGYDSLKVKDNERRRYRSFNNKWDQESSNESLREEKDKFFNNNVDVEKTKDDKETGLSQNDEEKRRQFFEGVDSAQNNNEEELLEENTISLNKNIQKITNGF